MKLLGQSVRSQETDIDDDIYIDCEDHVKIMNEILVVLIGTYQKIITATVTYYLFVDVPVSYNLNQAIALIIVEDCIKIIKIIKSGLMQSMEASTTNLKSKMLYCLGIGVAVIIIKFGIDKISSQDKKILVQKILKEEKY